MAVVATVGWIWRTRKLKKDIITLRRDPERTAGLGLRVLDITKYSSLTIALRDMLVRACCEARCMHNAYALCAACMRAVSNL